MVITPTIGRIVWYWPPATTPVRQPQGSPEPGVPLWQGDGERPAERFCEWMPYQIGQAKQVLQPV